MDDPKSIEPNEVLWIFPNQHRRRGCINGFPMRVIAVLGRDFTGQWLQVRGEVVGSVGEGLEELVLRVPITQQRIVPAPRHAVGVAAVPPAPVSPVRPYVLRTFRPS